ncbi:MAG: ATP-dependent RecD-like DNA helicase [Lachnospiraceae bacterium]|nr:ATP-dependent RecD-like DNA helicase [Lachnospiraceae bacterium]
MEKFRGYIDHFIYKNAENGYAVLVFICDGHEETMTGTFSDADTGDILEVEGEYVEHNVYGRQVKVSSYRILEPTDEESMERYLASGAIKGVGAALARRIINTFHEDTFRIMEEEPECLAQIKGISLNKAQEIGAQMREKRDMREVMVFLQRYGITGALALKLYAFYDTKIYSVLRENPYRIAEEVDGIGFRRADEIATKAGIEMYSEYRIRSGILYTLQLAGTNGHCYLPRAILKRHTLELLSLEGTEVEEAFDAQMDALMMERKIIMRDEDAVYSAVFYHAESSVASMLFDLKEAFDVTPDEEAHEAEKEVRTIEAMTGIELDDLQRQAVTGAVTNGVFILSGGPGTGKTTTINMMIRLFTRRRYNVVLAAPTGRAAKRMTEATGFEAKTIHRLLEANGETYERDKDNPLEADAVIIDEMSMVDIRLFQALLRAMVSGMHLVLVGDAAQLPSVGPGQVLKDLIASKCFATVVLQKIFRQAEESDIVLNAHRIFRGESIRMDNHSKDFFFLPRDNAEVICKHIIELIRKKLPSYVGADESEIQVLTPMKRGALGAVTLNRFLQEQLNPPHPSKKEYAAREDVIFREGDKVMQVKNNYQAEWEILGGFHIPVERGTGVFNGDVGIIRSIDHRASEITVVFDEGRQVHYPFSASDELEIAYAVTIHKSQGSEYPAVLLPLLGGPKMLLNRNLLYTAVTRAKRCVILLGSATTIQEMIDNEEQLLRYSGLQERLKEAGDIE